MLGPFLAISQLRASDGTAGIANGGLRARHETRVAMKSEKLFISGRKIRVEREDLNGPDQDVDPEAAFPGATGHRSVFQQRGST